MDSWIGVDLDGTLAEYVKYDGANIGVSGVRSTVEQLLLKDDRPVVVQVDKAVRSELLVEVIDEAKLAGASAVNIATLKP